MKRILIAISALLLIVLIAASCSATPKESSIGYVIGKGPADSQEVKEVVMPGERVTKERDDVVEYIYSNPRNYRIARTDAADVNSALVANSKASDDGLVPGYPVETQIIVYFAMNRDKAALEAFYPFCKKFGCDIDQDENTEDLERSSDPGWRAMLNEGMYNPLSNAYRQVIAEYDVSIVNDPAAQREIGAKMAELAMDEISDAAGMNGKNPFCNTNVTSGAKGCDPIRIEIQDMRSPEADTVLKTRRDQENNTRNKLSQIESDAEIQRQTAALEQQKANDAQALYAVPGYAQERAYQAYLEQIKECAGKCIITIGGEQDLQFQSPVG